MRSQKLSRISLLILILFISLRCEGSIVWRSLPGLINDSSVIAKGKISVKGDKIILDVEKTLKGSKHNQITVLYVKWFEVASPKFTDSEKVLLFLGPKPKGEVMDKLTDHYQPKEGELYLNGLGDQAKWPRVYPEKSEYKSYPKLQSQASLEAIQDVVEKLLIIEDANNIDEKVKFCTKYIKSSDKLLQFTTLQFVIQDGLWPPRPAQVQEPVPSSSTISERNSILKKFSEEIIVLSLIDDKESTIRAEAIRFLRYIQPYKAISLLISKLTDDDRLVRSNSRQVLNIFSGELKLAGELASYKSDDSMENYKSIQKKWNDWWEKNKEKFITKD